VLKEKRSYKQIYLHTEANGTEIYDGENYPMFPIVPLYANEYKQSELVGIREQIDCHDLIKSGYANNVDEASMIYWTLNNTGGMDDIDMVKFIERMKTIHAADIEEGQAQANSIEAPYASREALLNRLRNDLYEDYMALDVNKISAGAITATEIKAAYEAVDDKADEYEYQLIEFIQGILVIAGIEDNPTFTRSKIVNTQEEIQTVISASTVLPEDYVTKKVLTLLGDGDQADEILKQMADDEFKRLNEKTTRTASMYEITSVLGKLKRGDITEKTAMSMLIRIGLTEEEAEDTLNGQLE
jgi:SPP1 family phage portal protein